MSKRCRHNGTWIIGGFAEWCYECGAYRKLRGVGTTTVTAASHWLRPVGIGGANPFEKWMKTWRSPD